MPGCTVPRCSNSTQKGFKLFHFPSDRERCALWVKNCGREEGWKPTRYTCICEVHFEESQFELHRADGLRKLKPYAVPTIFNYETPNIHRKRKKSNSEIEKETNAEKTAKRYRSISTEDVSSITRKVHQSRINVKIPLRKDTKIIKSEKEMGKHASLKTKDSTNASQVSDTEEETRKESQCTSEANTCFICNSRNQNIVSNKAYTETSKTHLKQKLVQLVSVEFDLLVQDIGSICKNCSQILNCIDYIENVHYTLSKGILNHVKQRFCMEPTEHVNLKLYMKSLKNLNVFYPWSDKDGSHLSLKQKECVLINAEKQQTHQGDKSSEVADQVRESENGDHNIEAQKSVSLENKPENLTAVKNFECQMCSFATTYKAFMIYHLRQHFQSHYSCDFCNTPVAFDPSSAKELQTTNECFKISKSSECENNKPNEIPSPRFSKSQTNYQQHNSDSFEKRKAKMNRKRKDVKAQESQKNVKRIKISQK